MGEPPEHQDPWDRYDRPQVPAGRGFALRLVETEGRPVRLQLRCFKTPTSARQRNFDGRTLTDLIVGGDCVTIDLTPYEIADVELRFE
jgi:alpha-mannosidase